MTKKLATFCVLTFITLAQRPTAQPGTGRIFFVDIGQGAATLIVSPTGKTMLVDGGPPGGGTKIGNLLTTLGIPTIDYTVLTHYHIDHDSGLTELLNAGRVAGLAFDNGDGPLVAPPNPGSTRTAYLNYVAGTGHPGVTRHTILPGQVIDLGGGMRVTCLAAGGQLLTGGSVTISNEDLNTSSISLLVEFNNFDFIVSGDLTGGGSTSTLKTPDVETFVGQLAGDVDVIQLNHHGSTTTSNQVYLSTVKAEVALAEIGTTNTFGHPNRETVNKYLNTPVTSGLAFGGTGVPAPGAGPVFYQPEESPTSDDRVSHQGHSGASAAAAGNGTILLETDGVTTYSLKSFDDLGVRLNPSLHVYAVDGASAGVTTDFPPTVVVQTAPVAPLAVESVVVSAAVNDRESPISGVVLDYAVDGVLQTPLPMTPSGGVYEATIPAQLDGARVDFQVSGTTGGQTTSFTTGYFSGTTPVASLRAIDVLGVPMFNGYAARIHGTVTAGSNTFGSGTNDDYVQDATGGINVFRSTETATPFSATTPGLVVDVVGRIGFNGGRARLDITESLEKLTSPYGITIASSGAAPIPAGVTIGDLNLNLESYQGQLVSIPNVQIVSGSLPITPQSVDTFVTIDDGTGTLLAESRSQHRHRGLQSGHDLHGRRHHSAGRLPAPVRLGLQHRSARPARFGRGCGGHDARQHCRRAHRCDRQRRCESWRGLHPRLAESAGEGAGGGDFHRLPRRQRDRVLRSGRVRRHRPLQRIAELRSLLVRRQRRSRRPGGAFQWLDGDQRRQRDGRCHRGRSRLPLRRSSPSRSSPTVVSARPSRGGSFGSTSSRSRAARSRRPAPMGTSPSPTRPGRR